MLRATIWTLVSYLNVPLIPIDSTTGLAGVLAVTSIWVQAGDEGIHTSAVQKALSALFFSNIRRN